MDCKQIAERLVFLYNDGEMTHELRLDFHRHMDDCPHCARRAEHTRRFLMVVRGTGRCTVPNGLRDRILARLRGN